MDLKTINGFIKDVGYTLAFIYEEVLSPLLLALTVFFLYVIVGKLNIIIELLK